MKYLMLFEFFKSKEERSDYYRALKANEPIENRIYTIDKLKEFSIPEEIVDMMKSWDVILKSPYSNTFYNSKDITWNYKPDNSYRVSDHWNFVNRDRKHCKTDKPVKNVTHISIGKYDRSNNIYKILLSLPTEKHLLSVLRTNDKIKYVRSPEVLANRKNFKAMVNNHEVFCDIEFGNKKISGVVSKYTGNELKVKDIDGNLVFNNSYLDVKDIKSGKFKLTLYNRDNNKIENPFDIDF